MHVSSSGFPQKRKLHSTTLFSETCAVSIESLAATENVGTCYFRCTNSRSAEATIGEATEPVSLITRLEAVVFLPEWDSSVTGGEQHWAIVQSPSGSTTTAGTACTPSSDSTKLLPPPPHIRRHTFYAMDRSRTNQQSNEAEQLALFFRFNNQSVFYVDYSQIKSVELDKARQNSASSTIDSLIIEFDCCYFRVYNNDDVDSPERRSTTSPSDRLLYAKCLFHKYILGQRCLVPWESLTTANYPWNIGSVGTSSETAEQSSTSEPSSSHEPGQQQEQTDPSISQPASQNSTLSFPGSEESPASTAITEKDKPLSGATNALSTTYAGGTSSPTSRIIQSVYDLPSDYLTALPTGGVETVLHSANLLLPLSLKKRKQQIEQNCDAIVAVLHGAQQKKWLPQRNHDHMGTDDNNISQMSSLAAHMFAVLEKNSTATTLGQHDDLGIFEENYDHTQKRLKEDVEKCFTQLFPSSRVRFSQQNVVAAPPSMDPYEVFQKAERLIQMLKVSTASRHVFAMEYCCLKR
jgi:hypothetical protein